MLSEEGSRRVDGLLAAGLLEFPAPVFGLGRFSIPVLGGAYLRLIPEPLFRLALRMRSLEVGDWTYAHPYDFDTTEPFFRRPDQPWLEAKLLFARRRLMLRRFNRLVVSGSPTLGECAERLGRSADLPVFPSEVIPA